MTGHAVVAVPAVGSKLNEHLAALEHNRKVAAAKAENERRKAKDADRSQIALCDFPRHVASALDAALRPKAASLLL
eukprot:6773352-Prymnesium_polylepis.1